MKPNSIVPGEQAPGRFWEMSPSPRGQSADRRCADRRTVAALRLGLSLQREGTPAHDADRLAFRRFTAAFSLDLKTAFWSRTGAADRRNALDSAGFPPRSSAPTSPLPDGPM